VTGFKVRKYVIDVPTDGSTTSSVFIGNEPNACGWLLSFSVNLQDGQFITGNLTGRDIWEDNRRGVRFDDWDVSRGGNLFVPYSSLELSFQDTVAGSGADISEIRIVARSVALGTQVDHYNSVLYGTAGPTEVASGATGTFTAPRGAGWFQANIGAAGGPWIVSSNRTPGGGTAEALAMYQLDFSDSTSGDVGGEAWRLVGANGTITMRNNHGSAAGDGIVYWRYDLKSLT
jgi:hypothetical protein